MKKIVILQLLLLLAGMSFGQNKGMSLDQRWNKMLDKAETFQLYKVIKKSELSEVWTAVEDSISRLESELAQERNKISHQQSQIASLQNQVKDVNGRLDASTTEKDKIVFMGMKLDKYSYSTTLWIVIFISLAACGISFFLYNNSNRVAMQKTSEYNHLSGQFEEYKQSKIDMERKLKRELQTQINKIEELQSKQSRV